jgi:hypothetical protein
VCPPNVLDLSACSARMCDPRAHGSPETKNASPRAIGGEARATSVRLIGVRQMVSRGYPACGGSPASDGAVRHASRFPCPREKWIRKLGSLKAGHLAPCSGSARATPRRLQLRDSAGLGPASPLKAPCIRAAGRLADRPGTPDGRLGWACQFGQYSILCRHCQSVAHGYRVSFVRVNGHAKGAISWQCRTAPGGSCYERVWCHEGPPIPPRATAGRPAPRR